MTITTTEKTNTNQHTDNLLVGQQIRHLRKKAGLTLQEVATATGMSVGLLSQIERNFTDPSMRSLRLLATALDIPIARFFDEQEQIAQPENYIVRHNSRRRVTLKNGLSKHLIVPNENGLIETYLVHLLPDANSGDIKYIAKGEKFCYVLKGELHVTLNGNHFTLVEGDSFRIPTDLPHAFSNISNQPCEFIWSIVLLNKL
ncbi:cupin domain-containing protein [Pelistega suis]|uniref:Cupin domain-containing protein n=1 Tax=Pelistega suis TaxID=1631957 RepID=A0A849P4F7_9BURK|nr:cupin domain-containing protein [Pelistega suis]NOL50605.1 cupin domain-containing protein [Pelistega suis]